MILKNLGNYRTLVEAAKKCGGPGKLVAGILMVGAAAGSVITWLVKK